MELKNLEIIKIGELKTFKNDFTILEFVAKDDSSQYPQEIQFQCVKDKAENFLKYNKVGQRVDIDFNINGRSWLKEGESEDNRRWFNSLDAWKVTKSNNTETALSQAAAVIDAAFEPAGDLNKDVSDDGLPF